MAASTELTGCLREIFYAFEESLEDYRLRIRPKRVGVITFVGEGIIRAKGLPGLRLEELVELPGRLRGVVFDLEEHQTGVVLLDEAEEISAGEEIYRTERVLDTPVGEEMIGRVVGPLGRPLDGRGPAAAYGRRPVERPAPAIMDRAPVTTPLQTGIKVVDALIPIGRGQRELVVGDRQTGKTALAVDAILNQKDTGVICIYCGIGKRGSAVAKVVETLRNGGAMEYSVVITATEDDPPGLQFEAPYAAAALGEYFMEQGRDVLVVYDDLTRHARAYRQVSLLLRRPPGREAYPGDIFYIHSRLLERSTHLRRDLGGGSLTALPIVETEAENISAYIPTNLISITDGQIYLSPTLFQKGVLPAVDVGKSVSRVGGKTQLPAYRQVAGDLRLSYSQFEELESFARFGTRMDEETRRTIERGRRVREVLKQAQYDTMTAAEQIAVLWAVNRGLLDEVETGRVSRAEEKIRSLMQARLSNLAEKIEDGRELSEEDTDRLAAEIEEAVEGFRGDSGGGKTD